LAYTERNLSVDPAGVATQIYLDEPRPIITSDRRELVAPCLRRQAHCPEIFWWTICE